MCTYDALGCDPGVNNYSSSRKSILFYFPKQYRAEITTFPSLTVVHQHCSMSFIVSWKNMSTIVSTKTYFIYLALYQDTFITKWNYLMLNHFKAFNDVTLLYFMHFYLAASPQNLSQKMYNDSPQFERLSEIMAPMCDINAFYDTTPQNILGFFKILNTGVSRGCSGSARTPGSEQQKKKNKGKKKPE